MRRQRIALLIATALSGAIAGCSLENQSAPSFTGPSEFALSVSLTATPDQLPRDGTSQSTITVSVRDAQARAVSGQRLSVSSSVGSVSQPDVVTNADGRATFTFTAPSSATVGNAAVVQAIPLSGNSSNAVSRSVSILLTGTSNSTAPTPAFTVSPAAPVLQEPVVFDASATTDEGAPCRDVCTYSWDFGGELVPQPSGRVVTYRFKAIRTYPVKLTVTDAAGSSATLTTNVTVSQGNAPTASFAFSPASPGQFETIFFTAEASRVGVTGRTINTYQWNFGDGPPAPPTSSVTASHVYNVIGTYPVTLTVTDSAGIQGTTSQNIIVVNGVTAEFTISPSPSRVGQATFFDPEGSRGSENGFGGRNRIERYIWSWGDSTALEEITAASGRVVASHTYSISGTITINLTVIDSANRRQTINHTLTVNP